MKITANLMMAELEPSVAFWQRFGMELTVSIPHGEKMGFAMLAGDGAELMLQSHASASEDVPAVEAHCRTSKAVLFIEMPDFDKVLQVLGDWPVAIPQRDTFYGMREIGVMEPGGHLVVFASRIS
ncbi:MAG: hypothetical protein JNK87_36750 [Bryobacterales bacterium]|nr:hypothetical protein [Bryobacterales bacterium]